jgi:hypothetical protein
MDRTNFKPKGKILITINGGDKILALFRKYARQSGNKWYGIKAYVRQKAGKGGFRYEIFYANYKFDDRAVDILSDTFRNNWSSSSIEEGDKSQFKEATDEGAIYINSDGTDVAWSEYKKKNSAVGHFDARNNEDKAYKDAEAPKNEIVKAPKGRKKRMTAGSLVGGYYTPYNHRHFGSTFAYSPSRIADEEVYTLNSNEYSSI